MIVISILGLLSSAYLARESKDERNHSAMIAWSTLAAINLLAIIKILG